MSAASLEKPIRSMKSNASARQRFCCRAVRVDALIDDARADGRVYSHGLHVRGADLQASVHYDVFRTGVVDDEYLSEDFWVCRELRRLGFTIHLDPTVVTRHSGMLEA